MSPALLAVGFPISILESVPPVWQGLADRPPQLGCYNWSVAMRLVLVHSPLVGPATWEGVAPILAEHGYDVRVPDLRRTLAAGPPYCSRQVELIAGCCAGEGPVALAGHSGAGALLGPAGRAVDGPAGYLFVDAGLPIPGRTQMSTMPPELAAQLREMADAYGWLPPWPEWWAAEELAELVPDAQARGRFAAGCPRIPLAMFEEVQPEGAVARGGYLRLSEAYDEPAAEAGARGWPLIWKDSHHLAPLTDPGLVASALLDLLNSI
jgi:hypothetical protein